MSKRNETTEERYLTECLSCGQPIKQVDIKSLPKKDLVPKQGIWGGMELPYMIIHKVVCSHCTKKYTVKIRKSNWWYK